MSTEKGMGLLKILHICVYMDVFSHYITTKIGNEMHKTSTITFWKIVPGVRKQWPFSWREWNSRPLSLTIVGLCRSDFRFGKSITKRGEKYINFYKKRRNYNQPLLCHKKKLMELKLTWLKRIKWEVPIIKYECDDEYAWIHAEHRIL